MEKKLAISPEALALFCQNHHIRKLALFGSIAHGNDRPNSDIDLLVEFEPDFIPGFIALAGIENELSSLIGGRQIDLRTAKDLSRYFRDDVILNAEVQYAV